MNHYLQELIDFHRNRSLELFQRDLITEGVIYFIDLWNMSISNTFEHYDDGDYDIILDGWEQWTTMGFSPDGQPALIIKQKHNNSDLTKVTFATLSEVNIDWLKMCLNGVQLFPQRKLTSCVNNSFVVIPKFY